jgi:hypothetical protein
MGILVIRYFRKDVVLPERDFVPTWLFHPFDLFCIRKSLLKSMQQFITDREIAVGKNTRRNGQEGAGNQYRSFDKMICCHKAIFKKFIE